MYMCADIYQMRCGVYVCYVRRSMMSVLGMILLLVESPLRVSPAIDPVSLIKSHLWGTKQGIVDRLNTQHELIC